MDSNLQNIIRLVDYIETHLQSKLDLESLTNQAGYSKYHLHSLNIFIGNGFLKRLAS